jgi:hypothetical protein
VRSVVVAALAAELHHRRAINMSFKHLVLAIPLALMLTAPCMAGPPMELRCTGVLTTGNERNLRLKPDPGLAPWCDAFFEEYDDDDTIAKRVRTTFR